MPTFPIWEQAWSCSEALGQWSWVEFQSQKRRNFLGRDPSREGTEQHSSSKGQHWGIPRELEALTP